MKWNDFIQKLAKAKQEKRIVGNVTTGFMNLLYLGAMDSLISPQENKITLKDYDEKAEELKKALKSKFVKPKKKKAEDIGLSDVKDELTLGYWRYQNNPIARFNLKEMCKLILESKGFLFLKNKDIRGFAKIQKEYNKGGKKIIDTAFLTDNFQIFFENASLRKLFIEDKGIREQECDGKTIVDIFKLGILGMVVDKKISRTKAGSEKMSVTLFTGLEKTGELIFWPPKGTTELPKNVKDEIKRLSVYVFFVNLSEYNGNKGGNVRILYNEKNKSAKHSYFKVLEIAADKNKVVDEKGKKIFDKKPR
jgi:hypothetical protein